MGFWWWWLRVSREISKEINIQGEEVEAETN
jgi:hypothetical protein